MGKFISDFKDFALKGNVIDMAVGVIIGGAFGKIVSSLVDDILMPIISLLTGGVSFENLNWTIPGAEEGKEAVLNYGMFIQNVVDFLIIALCIFVVLRYTMKLVNSRKKEEEAAPAPAPEPSSEEKLLTEIRDLLKDKK